MNNQRNLFPRWENTPQGYGLVAIALHWVIAIMVLGLFSLGLWMTDLTYYHAGYKWAPEMHKGFGSLLFVLMVLRLTWRMANVSPQLERSIPPWQRRLAEWNHRTLYGLLFILMLSGLSHFYGRWASSGCFRCDSGAGHDFHTSQAGRCGRFMASVFGVDIDGFYPCAHVSGVKTSFYQSGPYTQKNALQRNE